MPIVLPPDHPRADLALAAGDPAAAARRVRIGIINIMPRMEEYEASLLAPLAEHDVVVEPVLIRLRSHGYGSSDHNHLDRFYRELDEVLGDAPLDGLIVTGAPVEELPYEDVHYFKELRTILGYARRHIPVTLGLCWGGMVLGKLLGIEKRALPRKLFGVFEDRALIAGHDLVPAGKLVCAHSRHSGLVEGEVDIAVHTGAVRRLSRGDHSGTSLFETTDGRFVAHLGHPEYNGERLSFEWERDRSLGRRDVRPPVNFDPDQPTTPWRGHRHALFAGFLRRAASVLPVAALDRGEDLRGVEADAVLEHDLDVLDVGDLG
ncbi:MAG TPA: homoserine O-succinyltransferase [Kofleriaceae bacterium]|nr:homoserine O-succinyltransferase [Kofleriaceae bacterium]